MERISRVIAVVFVVVGGLVHLQLWRAGYRTIAMLAVMKTRPRPALLRP